MEERKKSRIPRSKGIAGTYIHIKDVPAGLSTDKAHSYLARHVNLWAEENFEHAVIIKIRVEEGSLTAWVVVGGIALFNFVAGYGSFRSGIDHIVHDATAFSDILIRQFKEDKGVSDGAVLRAERRLGVPGKIQRFYKQLDKLNDRDFSHNEREAKIRELQEEFTKILELLENNQDRQLFMEEVSNEISQPDSPRPNPILGVIDLAILRDEDEWD